mmetsp:Transcript_47629/g.103845  ORF Transcript_47629/g.103845 Transcript_47629/m.103845 type:complete len:269 (-) Transcript_47629:1156-1962(-)
MKEDCGLGTDPASHSCILQQDLQKKLHGCGSVFSKDHCSGFWLLVIFLDPNLVDEPLQVSVDSNLLDHSQAIVHGTESCPQGALVPKIVVDPPIFAILHRGPVLSRNLPQTIWHSSNHHGEVLQTGEFHHSFQGLKIQLGTTRLMIRVNEGLQEVLKMILEKLELGAIEVPPEFVAQATLTKATPIQHATAQLSGLIPPVVSIVHVQIRMRQCHVIQILVFPAFNLHHVCGEFHQRISELVNELLLDGIGRKKMCRCLREELDTNSEL